MPFQRIDVHYPPHTVLRSNRSRITRMNGARTTAINVAYHQADQQHRQMAPDKAPLCIAPSAHG